MQFADGSDQAFAVTEVARHAHSELPDDVWARAGPSSRVRMACGRDGYTAPMTDSPDNPRDHDLRRDIGDAESGPEEMQERLDELGEGIEATRRQAEADDLLPAQDDDTGSPLDKMEWPEGDPAKETPVSHREDHSTEDHSTD